MSNLKKGCPFGPTKKWEKHDALGNPLPDVHKGFKQPEKIKVKRIIAAGEHKQSFKIVLDQGEQGGKLGLHLTLPSFLVVCATAWGLVGKTNCKELFGYFAC